MLLSMVPYDELEWLACMALDQDMDDQLPLASILPSNAARHPEHGRSSCRGSHTAAGRHVVSWNGCRGARSGSL